MSHKEFIDLCIEEVFNSELSKDYSIDIMKEDVFIVWSCKTLQNSKALLSMPHLGSDYYECTLDGDNNKVYIDVYTKLDNRVICY